MLSYPNPLHPLRRQDNSWAKTDQEIAETFAFHLSEVFQPYEHIYDEEHVSFVINELNTPLPLSPPPTAFHPKEVALIIQKLPTRKAPGFDLITPAILKHLPRKTILYLTLIYNSVLRTTYFPVLWKYATIKMIHKKGKPLHSPSSYRPISLLPIMGKILEKLILKRLTPILEPLIPPHQFGFRSKHSTIQQCHRIIDSISSALEGGEYCSGVFLDMAQAFDRVWHQGLLFKLKGSLPFTYYLIIQSYLTDRYFDVLQGPFTSSSYPQLAGVPQGGILSPLLFLIYAADLPTHPSTTLLCFADDTAVLSSNPDPNQASQSLQEHLGLLEPWLSKWRFKVNPEKSAHITFTLRRSSCPPVELFHQPIPIKTQIKYLGLILDKRLTWGPHITSKRHETNRRYKLLLRLLDHRSRLTLQNKRLIYLTILQPTWSYGIEVWGCAKPSNIQKIQSLQSRILRKIANAPFYVNNRTLHSDFNIPFVQNLASTRYHNFHSRLPSLPNPFAHTLHLEKFPENSVRRLKRRWPRDLL